ncbi:MAG: PKD domain-containing protein, partial [Planctomycetota bacterium]
LSPTASFTATPTDLDLSVDASASTDSDGTIASYSWDFGDGGTGSGANASHTYASAGTYTVTLTVSDDDGAIGTATETVRVSQPEDDPDQPLTIDVEAITTAPSEALVTLKLNVRHQGASVDDLLLSDFSLNIDGQHYSWIELYANGDSDDNGTYHITFVSPLSSGSPHLQIAIPAEGATATATYQADGMTLPYLTLRGADGRALVDIVGGTTGTNTVSAGDEVLVFVDVSNHLTSGSIKLEWSDSPDFTTILGQTSADGSNDGSPRHNIGPGNASGQRYAIPLFIPNTNPLYLRAQAQVDVPNYGLIAYRPDSGDHSLSVITTSENLPPQAIITEMYLPTTTDWRSYYLNPVSDPDGDPIEYIGVYMDDKNAGRVDLNGYATNITYNPEGFVGTVVLTYRVFDWINGETAGESVLYQLTIHVVADANDIPTSDIDQELKPGPGTGYGHALAMDGDWLATSSVADNSVVLYRQQADGSWNEFQTLTCTGFDGITLPLGRPDWHCFGDALALDGNRLAVGAQNEFGDDTYDYQANGAVYTFLFNGTSWVPEQRIPNSKPQAEASVNMSLSLNGDQLAVGYPLDNRSGMAVGSGTGAVELYSFDASSGQWQPDLIFKHKGQAGALGHRIIAVGDTLFITNPHTLDTDQVNPYSGKIYISRVINGVRENGGQAQMITASDSYGDPAHYGYAIDVKDDLAVIGAPGQSESWNPAAYILRRGSDGTWREEIKLSAPQLGQASLFGSQVAIVNGKVYIGAPKAGQVLEYSHSNGTWRENRTFKTGATAAVNGLAFTATDTHLIIGIREIGNGVIRMFRL